MANLKQLAAKIAGGSALMENRHKLETKDVCGIELTIRDFDIISYEQNGQMTVFPVIIFDEIQDGYYQGGLQLKRLCEAIDEDPELKNDLKTTGLKIILESSRTRSGNDFVNFTVLD